MTRLQTITSTFLGTLSCGGIYILSALSVFSLYGQEEAPPKLPSDQIIAEAPMQIEAWLKASERFQAGLNCLKNNLPEVATKNFLDLLKQDPLPPENVRPYIHRYLAESYTRAHDYDNALIQIELALPAHELKRELSLWKSIALKGKNRYSEALRILEQWEKDLSPDSPDKVDGWWLLAELNRALKRSEESRHYLELILQEGNETIKNSATLALSDLESEMGRYEEAHKLLMPLLLVFPIKKKPTQIQLIAQLLELNVLLGEKKPQEALEKAEQLLKRKDILPVFIDMLKISAAKSEIALEKAGQIPLTEQGKGEDRLLSFIESTPDSAFLSEAFDILRQEKAFETAEAYKKLQNWVNGEHPKRTPYAFFTMIQELILRKEISQMLELAKSKVALAQQNAIILDAELLALQQLQSEGKWNEAKELISLMPEHEAKTLLLRAALLYGEGKDKEASACFQNAFNLLKNQNPVLAQQAAYNAALAALESGLVTAYQYFLSSPDVFPKTKSSLVLESALFAASELDPKAKDMLKAFIKEYPDHTRRAEALLSLAELCLYQEEVDETEILNALTQLRALTLSPEEKERSMRLQILLPEYKSQWTAAIQAAKDYLNTHSGENKVLVQLKLGELLYRNKDYNQALLYLLNLSQNLEKNTSAYATSLFLAAKAAQNLATNASLTQALDLFNEVAKQPFDYAAAAEIEAASILMRQGKAQEVVNALEPLLLQKDKTLPDEIKRLSLALLAEAYGLMGLNDKTATQKAINYASEILKQSNLTESWKYRTLFQRARLAEQAGDLNAALQDYNDILSSHKEHTLSYEWFWYYQAGFAAMHLLENTQQWSAAIKIAEKLVASGGPRAQEAANRARKIRLEHFVWNPNEADPTPSAQDQVDETPEQEETDSASKEAGEEEPDPKIDSKFSFRF